MEVHDDNGSFKEEADERTEKVVEDNIAEVAVKKKQQLDCTYGELDSIWQRPRKSRDKQENGEVLSVIFGIFKKKRK